MNSKSFLLKVSKGIFSSIAVAAIMQSGIVTALFVVEYFFTKLIER